MNWRTQCEPEVRVTYQGRGDALAAPGVLAQVDVFDGGVKPDVAGTSRRDREAGVVCGVPVAVGAASSLVCTEHVKRGALCTST